MLTKESAIEALQEKLDELHEITDQALLFHWKQRMILTLVRIYGEKDIATMAILNIRTSSTTPFSTVKRNVINLINSQIKDLERFGVNTSKKTDDLQGINLSVNQNNHQTQSIDVSISLNIIMEALKGELRTSEIEDLKEILETEEEPKVKKRKFVAKIKSFGSDVASNILAGLLSNPQVYDQLGNFF